MSPWSDIVFQAIFLSILGVAALYVFVSAGNEHSVRAEAFLLQNPAPGESKSLASREDGFGERKMEYSTRKLLEYESQAPSELAYRPVNGERGIGWVPLFIGIGIFFFFAYFMGRKARMFAKEEEIRKSQRRVPIKNVPVKPVEVVDVKPEESRSELVFFVEDDEAFKFDDLLEAEAELKVQLPCSSLYKVILKSGAVYTVKRLKKFQGSFEEFGQTMTRIGKLKHPNILLLVGYNSTPEGKLLMYKYQNNGSLFDLLDDHMKGKKLFPWNLRLYIAWGIARGLDFIHRSSENKSEIIPHGNLKPSNIILGDHMESLISDYGLSKFLALDGICLYSSAKYTAPEKHISEKGDVYSFGVMLLELLTGKVVENSRVDLPKWVKYMVREEWTGEVFDREVAAEAKQAAFLLLNISLKCIADSPEDRPSMAEVLDKIEDAMNGQLQHQGPDSPVSYGQCGEDDRRDCCLLHSVIPETWDSPGSNY